ncbi:MAG: polysaccharide pyruvyl transferase family protein [Phormidesmis sp.]
MISTWQGACFTSRMSGRSRKLKIIQLWNQTRRTWTEMKVGIITFHHTTNYGATLQAYALWETIRDQGHGAELIDYRPHSAVRHYQRKVYMPEEKRRGKKHFVINLFKNFLPNLKRYTRMRYFLTSHITLSRKILDRKDLPTLFEDDQGYDAIVAGSDQVWCTTSIRGFDPSYFLDFIPKSSECKKISYAASFGPTKTLADERDTITRLVQDFDAIAVRDSNSLSILQRDCGETATKVLDPTFLTDFKNVIPTRPRSQPYLLLYLEKQISQEEKRFIQSTAERQGLKIISIGNSYGIADKVSADIDPKEWLWHFKHASFIVTNFYHGTIFSIKFGRQFTMLARESKINKAKDLLDMLDLTHRMVTQADADTVTIQSAEIDYESVNKLIEQEVHKSRSYLVGALSQSSKIPSSIESVGVSSIS